MTIWEYNDGGREEAGYKGYAGDCTVRAICIAAELPYQKVYDELFELNHKNNKRGKPSPRDGGTSRKTTKEYMKNLGWSWKPTMGIGTGCRVHLKKSELPSGRIMCSVSRHLVAVVDGVVQDTFDCTRDGTRCVYGYWYKEDLNQSIARKLAKYIMDTSPAFQIKEIK